MVRRRAKWPPRMGCRLCASASADRKSTRLNSSHSSISYAVFCLKKKKKENEATKVTTRVLEEERVWIVCVHVHIEKARSVRVVRRWWRWTGRGDGCGASDRLAV